MGTAHGFFTGVDGLVVRLLGRVYSVINRVLLLASAMVTPAMVPFLSLLIVRRWHVELGGSFGHIEPLHVKPGLILVFNHFHHSEVVFFSNHVFLLMLRVPCMRLNVKRIYTLVVRLNLLLFFFHWL